jgi:phosphoribosylanthranilate isomerase
MRVKICGITKPEQAQAIAELGATAIGFMCVPQSPRYVTLGQMQAALERLPPQIDRIGVFANESVAAISKIIASTALTGVQLHGQESPEFCQQLRQFLPAVEIVKALRVRAFDDLSQVDIYYGCGVNTLLLDAYHPQMLGGTGKTLDWKLLQQFQPQGAWLLAGGLTPDNILDALNLVSPSGIDLSSGVERSPGDKDLDRVAKLFENLAAWQRERGKGEGVKGKG